MCYVVVSWNAVLIDRIQKPGALVVWYDEKDEVRRTGCTGWTDWDGCQKVREHTRAVSAQGAPTLSAVRSVSKSASNVLEIHEGPYIKKIETGCSSPVQFSLSLHLQPFPIVSTAVRLIHLPCSHTLQSLTHPQKKHNGVRKLWLPG